MFHFASVPMRRKIFFCEQFVFCAQAVKINDKKVCVNFASYLFETKNLSKFLRQ